MASYKVHIKNPCKARWDTMTPKENGRHCAACKKTVVDFTSYSKHQVWAAIHSNPHQVCGRFSAKQLSEVYSPVRYKAHWVTSGLFSMLTWLSAEHAVSSEVDKTLFPTEISISTSVSDTLVSLHGTLRDNQNLEPIPFAVIYVNETPLRFGVNTNFEGEFQFQVPKSYVEQKRVFTIEAFGYDSLSFVFSDSAISMHTDIFLEPEKVDSNIVTKVPIGRIKHPENYSWEANDSNSVVIKGIVQDSLSKERLPFVDVYIPGRLIVYRCHSNFDGEFELRLPKEMAHDTVTLGIRFVGYAPQGAIVVPINQTTPLTINMYTDSNLMGDVVIVRETPRLKLKRWWYQLWHKKSVH